MTKSKVLAISLLIAIVVVFFGCVPLNDGSRGFDALFVSGDYPKAITEFKSCVDSEGDTGESASWCSFMLGKAYFDNQQYPEAVTYFERAINVYKKGMYVLYLDHAWNFWLGRAYLENKQYKEAIVNFDKAASIVPENSETLIPSDYTAMRKYYLPLIPPKSDCYFWLGFAYYQDAQYQEAMGALRRAIELNPTDPHSFNILARAYTKLKQFDQAIGAVKRSIGIKPTEFAYSALATIYTDKKQYNDAIAAYKKAIELKPKNISNYFLLSNCYVAKDDYASAIYVLQKAQELAPDDADIPFAIGYHYMDTGKFDEAIGSLNKAIELLTFTGIGINGPIVVKGVMEAGPAKRAGIQIGDKIIRINGQSTKNWTDEKVTQNIRGAAGTQVVLTIERKDLDKPIEKTITRETIIKKSAAPIFGLRSLAYRIKGNTENADKDAQKAYSLDPNYDIAKEALGALYLNKGKYDDAIKILSNTSKDGYFARILEATAYAKGSGYKKAVEIYSSIPEDYLASSSALRQSYKKMLFEYLNPYISAQKERAISLETKGQYKKALNVYVEILKVADDNEAKEIRANIAKLIKEHPYIAELHEEARRHAMRAETSTKEGKFEDAVKEYKEAIKIAPYFSMLYKAIALNYAELKQYHQAINNLKTYLELMPDAADSRASKDQIYKWEFMMEKEGR